MNKWSEFFISLGGMFASACASLYAIQLSDWVGITVWPIWFVIFSVRTVRIWGSK